MLPAAPEWTFYITKTAEKREKLSSNLPIGMRFWMPNMFYCCRIVNYLGHFLELLCALIVYILEFAPTAFWE